MNATQNTAAPSYDAVDVVSLLCPRAPGLNLVAVIPPPKTFPGFVTFYDPGWSIMRLREVVAAKGTIFSSESWYCNEPFAELKEPPQYRQLRMEPTNDSFNKTFAEQQALLSIDEEIPSARVVVMGTVIHFLATRDRLFPNCWVRCSDEDLDGDCIYVGDFQPGGIDVGLYWNARRRSRLGLASTRKF